MTSLKYQIREIERDLDNTNHYIQQQYKAFSQHPYSTALLTSAILGGACVGFLMGRFMHISYKTMIGVPLQINTYIATAKHFLEEK